MRSCSRHSAAPKIDGDTGRGGVSHPRKEKEGLKVCARLYMHRPFKYP